MSDRHAQLQSLARSHSTFRNLGRTASAELTQNLLFQLLDTRGPIQGQAWVDELQRRAQTYAQS